MEKKWYQKTGWIIFLLVFFFPVGLFLMWKYMNCSKNTKIAITAIILVIAVICYVTPDNDSEVIPKQNDVTAIADNVVNNDADKTEKAIATDEKIWEYALASENLNKALANAVSSAASGGTSLLNLYDTAKQVQSGQAEIFSALAKLQDKENKDYVLAVETYVSYSRSAAENIKKYIDKEEMKYLSNANEDIENCNNAMYSLVANRMLYLTNSGVGEEKVNEICGTDSNAK